MKENQKTHMSWLRDNKKMTFVSAIILSIMTVLGTIVLLVVPKPINYEAKDTVSAACILVVITAFGLSAFVVIDRMFVAWYHNRQPDVWERILSLIFLVAVPYGVLVYYWVVYRHLDARGQGEIWDRPTLRGK